MCRMAGREFFMSGTFNAANGTITTPDGQAFLAAGVGLEDNEVTASTASQILSLLPGTNMVRLGITSLTTPLSSTLQAFITQLTNAGVVVEIEDHNAEGFASSGANVPSGSALTNELTWYTAMAQQYASNPYVWFGTMNEPTNPTNQAAVSTQEEDIYNAIRGAGNSNPILLEQLGGWTTTGLVAADYASMTNVIWDTHIYGWESSYSTNQATVSSDLAFQVADAQSIQTAEGVVPVIIGEYGPSTDGTTTDPNGNQVIAAVQGSGVGALAWNWNAAADAVANNAGTALTAFGNLVAPFIASRSGSGSGGTSSTSGGSGSTASSGSTTPVPTQTATAGGAAGTSTDLNLTAPSSLTVAPGASVAVQASVSDAWAASQSGNMSAFIWDTTGNTFSVSGQAAATSLSLAGPLSQINADLATLQYNAISTAHSDTISIAVSNQAGVGLTETIPVAVAPAATSGASSTSSSGATSGSGTASGSGSSSSSGSGSSPGAGASTTPQTVTAGGATGTSTDLSLTAPSSETLASGASIALQPVNVSDTWAASQSGSMYAFIWDTTGNTFSISGQSTATSLTLTGSLSQINADLATLQYNATSSAASDTISIAIANQAGTNVTENIAVTIGSVAPSGSGSTAGSGSSSGSTAPQAIKLPGTSSTTTENVSNATITANSGNQILFIGGTHDAAILTGGKETVTANGGYNTITTGAGNDTITIGGTDNAVNAGAGANSITDDGSINTIVMPAAGHGMDNIYGSVLTNGDILNFAAALKATAWKGSASMVGEYLHVRTANNNAVISISKTANGSATTVADLHGAGHVSLSTLLAHVTL
jgi:hypothetical protein